MIGSSFVNRMRQMITLLVTHPNPSSWLHIILLFITLNLVRSQASQLSTSHFTAISQSPSSALTS